MSQSLTVFLAGFRSRWGALTVAACAGPLSLQLLAPNFVTPWPESPVATELATVTCAVGLLLAYQLFLRSAKALGRPVVVGLVLAGLCLLAYLGCYSTFVVVEVLPPSGSGQAAVSVIRGFTRLPEIAKHYPADYSDGLLWSEFEFKVDRVWTTSSITVARISTLLAYLGFFLFLTFAVALLGAHSAPARASPRKRVA